ncbi:hypothetical protein [Sporomusa sp.]|uniref:hypothetical protein n=1 Tax=Sporomusa sp. TaxID=2078658 RepID=UPI002C9DB5C1|nr:hypothetical protein [Sporomusa sp.]HWR44483.1 hypothetical protein [Sporomusa sp.]
MRQSFKGGEYLLCCDALISSDCPCTLAELTKCKYYPLPLGKEAFDYNTIISVISYPLSFGIIVKPEKSILKVPLGTILEIKLEHPFSVSFKGVLLRSYVSQGLIYIWSQGNFPTDVNYQQKLQIQVNGNAFWGHHFLNNAVSKHITIVGENKLFEPLQELSTALADNKNEVKLIANAKDIKQVVADTNIVLLAGSESHIKQVINLLPVSFQGQIAAWIPC